MMGGLGFSRRRFDRARLLPAARAYRDWLDRATTSMPWVVGAAVVTIFVEGSVKERGELTPASRNGAGRKFDPRADMLFRNHKLPARFLTLKRAHAEVESGHRKAAWEIVERHASTPRLRASVARALERSLRLWLAYRDGVARRAGLVKPRNIR